MGESRDSCDRATRHGAGYCEDVLHQEMDLALCADLERMADGLPSLPPTGELRRISVRLSDSAKRWASPEERERLGAYPTATQARILDSVHADDVVEAIWSYWREPSDREACLLGYMLRGLFDGRRRAIALERLALGCSQCQSSEID